MIITQEKTIELLETFTCKIDIGSDREVTVIRGYHKMIKFNGRALLKVGFGDFIDLTVRGMRYSEDVLKDVLKANGHLCRSDFM